MKVYGKFLVKVKIWASGKEGIVASFNTKNEAINRLDELFNYYAYSGIWEDKGKNCYWIEKNTAEYK